MDSDNELVVNEVWTRGEVREMLADSAYFTDRPDMLTDEMVDAFAERMSEAVSEAADSCCQSIARIAYEIQEDGSARPAQ